jgi:hypothetical protein
MDLILGNHKDNAVLVLFEFCDVSLEIELGDN